MRLTRVTALLALAFLGCTELGRLHASPHAVFFSPPFRFKAGQPPLIGFFTSFWKLADTSDSISTNTFTNNNVVTFVSAKVGNGANFVGSSSQSLSIASLPAAGGSFTVMLWFKSSSANLNMAMFSYKGGADTGFELNLNPSGSVGKVRFYTNAAKLIDSTASTYNDGNWHAVVAWHNSSTGVNTLIVDNGTPQTLSGTSDVSANAALRLGSTSGAASFYTGVLDACGFGDNKVSNPGMANAFWNGGSGVEPPF